MEMTERYIRLNEGLSGYGSIYPSNYLDNKDIYDKAINTYRYKSLFSWPKEAKEYYEKNNGKMRGYDGPGFGSKLIFDFDCETDNEKARQDAIILIERLESYGIGPNNCQVDFSGNKGFHIEVLLNKEIDYEKIGELCKSIANGLETFDDSIYDISRKIRLRNTKHEKTGLYKIPLSFQEFFNLDIKAIKELAVNKRNINNTILTSVNTDELIPKIKISEKPKVSKPKSVVVTDTSEEIRGLSSVNFKKCPSNVPRCIYALMHGIMVRGQGKTQKVLFHLANYLRNQGDLREHAEGKLRAVLLLNEQLYPEFDKWDVDNRLKNQVLDPVFDPNYTFKQVPGATAISPDNEFIKYYCDHIKCDKVCCLHKNTSTPVVTIKDVASDFEYFAQNFDKNSVKTGIGLIDDNMKIVSSTTTLLIGATGSGKTTLALDMMEKANKAGFNTMFFSMDMYKNLIYLKLAQKVTDYTQDEILYFYQHYDHTKINEIKEKIGEHYEKTSFDFSKTLTIEEMRDRVLRQQDATGKDIKLVVVDYASRLSGPHSDKHANATYNALKSVEVAEATDAAWIYIAQVSRNVGDGSTPLLSKRAAKESGDWEEVASNVITVWRPFMGVENQDNIIRMFLAKNRMGNELHRPLWWNGRLGTVKDMTPQEYQEYMEQRSQIENELQKSKKSNFSTSY